MDGDYALLAEAVYEAAVSDHQSAQVAFVLVEARKRGVAFEDAWFNALRSISPPRTCHPKLRVRIDENRALIHEVKPLFRAAYERRELSELERRSLLDADRRRLRDLRIAA